VKLQIIHEDKCFTIQLEFDPNFTIENLTNSIIDLLKIQNTVIYLGTFDNEVLIPNLKIVDLIFLNPGKYKKLKVLTVNSNFSLKGVDEKIEKIVSSKRYEVLQSTSDYLEEKNKQIYGKYNYNEEPIIKASNLNDYNFSNENKNFELSSDNKADELKYKGDVLNVAKDKEFIQSKSNLSSKTPPNYDDDYFGRDKYSYEDYSRLNNKSTVDLNTEGSNLNNTDNSARGILSNTNTRPNIKNVNTSSHDFSKYYDNLPNYPKQSDKSKTPTNKYDYTSNLNDLDTKNTSNHLSSNYTNKYVDYPENKNDNISNAKDSLEKVKTKIERDGSIRNLDSFNEKYDKPSNTREVNEDINRIGSLTSTANEYPTTKYNYSERIRDDLNKHRFASEKRNFRNNQFCKCLSI